jgi:formylglycine-generating enzyme required for sulfatase activity
MRLFKYLFLLSFSASSLFAMITESFPEASGPIEDWYHDQDYGWFCPVTDNWIWHLDHGWQWVACGDFDGSGVYVYDLGMGAWFWSSRYFYPWFYMWGEGDCNGWRMYDRSHPAGSRQFKVVDGIYPRWIHENLSGMVRIESDTLGDFEIGRTEVTKEAWDTVTQWGLANGYTLSPDDATGKGPNHPVCDVSWFEAIEFCNIKSAMEGLDPAYVFQSYLSSNGLSFEYCNFGSDGLVGYEPYTVTTPEGNTYTTYKGYTGVPTDLSYSTDPLCIYSDLQSNGYRLPSPSQWVLAAAGGESNNPFPWGDTISHARANFCNYTPEVPAPARWADPVYEDPDTTQADDSDPVIDDPVATIPIVKSEGTEGFHPDFSESEVPYTSPVGSFKPNGFGVYDMIGNLAEWCGYGSLSVGIERYGNEYHIIWDFLAVDRYNTLGGSWGQNMTDCQVYYSRDAEPATQGLLIGFRLCRNAE